MDFLYKNRNRIKTFLLVVLTLLVFALSYYICISKLGTEVRKYNSNALQSTDTLSAHSNAQPVVSKDAGIVFKIKYAKSGEIVTEKEQEASDLVGKNKKELDEFFKKNGYAVQSMTSTQVVLMKTLDKYSPNKYVLGIKDGFIAIYRTDKNGDMYIEDTKRDITDIKIEKLKKADIELLTKGNKYFECNTREDAESRLEDYE